MDYVPQNTGALKSRRASRSSRCSSTALTLVGKYGTRRLCDYDCLRASRRFYATRGYWASSRARRARLPGRAPGRPAASPRGEIERDAGRRGSRRARRGVIYGSDWERAGPGGASPRRLARCARAVRLGVAGTHPLRVRKLGSTICSAHPPDRLPWRPLWDLGGRNSRAWSLRAKLQPLARQAPRGPRCPTGARSRGSRGPSPAHEVIGSSPISTKHGSTCCSTGLHRSMTDLILAVPSYHSPTRSG